MVLQKFYNLYLSPEKPTGCGNLTVLWFCTRHFNFVMLRILQNGMSRATSIRNSVVPHVKFIDYDGFKLFAAVRYPFPEAEKVLYTFQSRDDLARWKIFTDQEFGGRTTAILSPMAEPPVCGTLVILTTLSVRLTMLCDEKTTLPCYADGAR